MGTQSRAAGDQRVDTVARRREDESGKIIAKALLCALLVSTRRRQIGDWEKLPCLSPTAVVGTGASVRSPVCVSSTASLRRLDAASDEWRLDCACAGTGARWTDRQTDRHECCDAEGQSLGQYGQSVRTVTVPDLSITLCICVCVCACVCVFSPMGSGSGTVGLSDTGRRQGQRIRRDFGLSAKTRLALLGDNFRTLAAGW
ncbi:unnamed protein product [Protopolystoma xenopodis]|uniref:Uncharacterized protein n=1 Tax=Protopolystoma xenopodis TaxID=117903 RepID=A0A3S5B2X8_9PLAT|nr:unnamed protein product [Protopolystoma xenopodis]